MKTNNICQQEVIQQTDKVYEANKQVNDLTTDNTNLKEQVSNLS